MAYKLRNEDKMCFYCILPDCIKSQRCLRQKYIDAKKNKDNITDITNFVIEVLKFQKATYIRDF